MNVMLEAAPRSTHSQVRNFEDLYRLSRDDLYSYVAGLLRDRSAAEDVTALAFERAYRKWEKFNPERGTARGWLFGIARNAALDELRKGKREVPLTHDPAAAESVADAGEDVERQATVTRALATLPAADRELISLKFYAGFTNNEIAETTEISPSNVGTRIHRAMTKLRNACQKEFENGF